MATSTTSLGVGTMAIVIAGQWSKGNLVPIKVIVGSTVYILLLSFVDEANPKLARMFAILVLITALFLYIIPVFQGVGLLEGGSKTKPGTAAQTRARKRRNGGPQEV